jgi:shikimate kinase
MKHEGNVILIGFMGAGKSSVGRLLAKRLGRSFVETDEMIVAEEGKPISAIFAEHGETSFRALEAQVLERLKLRRDEVITTGGGLPCGDGAMEALRSMGTVIWLRGDFDLIYERARRSGTRPMLHERSREEVEALYHKREPYYREAHLTIDVGGLSLDQVVARIISRLDARNVKSEERGA